MRIQAGEPARDFQVKDIFDQPRALADYRGRRLMLSFYRYASCPLCNLRVHSLIQRHEFFRERGLHLLAFFQSPKESILNYIGRQKAPFPIVADPEHIVYRAYGVESSWKGFLKGSFRIGDLLSASKKGFLPGKMEGNKAQIPADFLIGPELLVEKAFYGLDIGDHIPMSEIETWLEG